MSIQKSDKTADPNAQDAAALRKAAEDFEAVFLAQMLKQMRNTIHKEEMFHGGPGEDVFTELLDEQFAKKMAATNSVGIADVLFRQLSIQYGIAGEASEMPATTGAASALQERLRDVEQAVRPRGSQKADF